MRARTFIVVGAILGAIGVAAGAFGAHAGANSVTPERLKAFETAARYHQIHAIAILAVGLIGAAWPSSRFKLAGYLFLAGIILFSGSLYVLVLTDTGWLGAVTPVGGLALISGWLILAWGVGSRE